MHRGAGRRPVGGNHVHHADMGLRLQMDVPALRGGAGPDDGVGTGRSALDTTETVPELMGANVAFADVVDCPWEARRGSCCAQSPWSRRLRMAFRTHVTQEKTRLAQQRRVAQKRTTEVESELSDLRSELKSIDSELAAIAAYENARSDAPAPRGRRGRKADAPPPARTTRRRRRGSRQAEILSAIASSDSGGVGRAGIIAALGVKGDKSAEQSVSNALAALKKSGAVAHQDGKYTIAAEDSATG